MSKPIEAKFTRRMMAIVFPGKTLGEAVAETNEIVAKAESAVIRALLSRSGDD